MAQLIKSVQCKLVDLGSDPTFHTKSQAWSLVSFSPLSLSASLPYFALFTSSPILSVFISL